MKWDRKEKMEREKGFEPSTLALARQTSVYVTHCN